MTANEFLQLLGDTLGLSEKIELNARRNDINEWDSMGQIQILSMLEERFGLKLEMEDLVALESVVDIIRILNSKNIFFD